MAVMTIERVQGLDPLQLELSCATDGDGNQIISVTGELDIATAERAYTYISDMIDAWPAPVSVDLSGLTFCDASGLGALARIARLLRDQDVAKKLRASRDAQAIYSVLALPPATAA